MTLNEALEKLQNPRPGFANRRSVRYAQSLLLPGESVAAAVIANVATRKERFPGVVVLTDQRLLAVCGLPGIRRAIILGPQWVEHCTEKPSALNYQVQFATEEGAFSLTVDPDMGERLSRELAICRGELEAFEADGEGASAKGIFNPALARSKARAKAAQARQRQRQAQAAEQRAAQETPTAPEDETMTAAAERLQRELAAEKSRRQVSSTDPQAVAARLAAELAQEEEQSSPEQQ